MELSRLHYGSPLVPGLLKDLKGERNITEPWPHSFPDISIITINKQDNHREEQAGSASLDNMLSAIGLDFIGNLMGFIIALWHKTDTEVRTILSLWETNKR